MRSCPHCGSQAVSATRKLFMVPGETRRCRSCDKKVGVHWRSALAFLPVPLALVANYWIVPAELHFVRAGILALGLVLWPLMHWRFVPLVSREEGRNTARS
jgi:hypothetical protein